MRVSDSLARLFFIIVSGSSPRPFRSVNAEIAHFNWKKKYIVNGFDDIFTLKTTKEFNCVIIRL